jgi:folate-dependent phosphoribosylglycinamide formyltransferase PurN
VRTLLICHDDAPLDRECLARWLASFSDLVGIVVVCETKQRVRVRLRRELRRVGWLRMLDVLAFRFYYKLFVARRDRTWQEDTIRALSLAYPRPADARVLNTHSPNSIEAECFIKELRPEIILARCKTLLHEKVFSLASTGTFVMHPGICPEYRNAHGCFWALATRDLDRVGMTLLQIDRGVDTGPVYGYYQCNFDERRESHIVIQGRVVFDNLEGIRQTLLEVFEGRATPVDTSGRASRTWGQPWLTSYLRWKRLAKARVE